MAMMRGQRSEIAGVALKEVWEKNYEANKDFIKKTPDFGPMAAKPTDCKPCLAVGAGPSLLKNINDIDPKLYDIIACDKTVPMLALRGIVPSYIVALNAAPTMVRTWLQPAVNRSILVMPCSVHPSTYEGWEPEKCRFINNYLITGLNERISAELERPSILIGSNAGTFAYLLSAYTFHNPLAYIGMDFSFRSRAVVLEKQDPKRYNLVEMTDLWKGEEVRYLDLGWWDMVLAFQEQVQVLKQYYGLDTYNCTEGGVNYSPFTLAMTLKEFNDMFRNMGKEVGNASIWEQLNR